MGIIMKTKPYLFLIATVVVLSCAISCGTTHTAAQKAEIANEVRQKINNLEFTFKANYAYPTSFRSINLTPGYEVKVSSDTIESYLPYFGRAYTAPIDPMDTGIKFKTTKFDYEVIQGKKKGNWIIDIRVKDTGNDTALFFDIWENGTARLSVTDSKRQSISFTGEIELDEKE